VAGAVALDKPLTVSIWWSIPKEIPEHGGLRLIRIMPVDQGVSEGSATFISNYVRGGPWNGIQDSAAVLQVYGFKDIKPITNIYDKSIRETLNSQPDKWRNTTIVVHPNGLVEVYWDGHTVASSQSKNRTFLASDILKSIQLGDGADSVLIDDVLILQKAATAEEIATYFQHATSAKR
jgi:hypothetical protein